MSKKMNSEQTEVLKKVLRYMRRYWFYLAISIFLAAITVASTLYIPLLTGDAVDCIVGKGHVDWAGVFAVLKQMAMVIGVTALAQWGMNICNNKLTYQIVRDIRNEAFAKLEILPLKYIDRKSTGEIVSRIIADVDQFARWSAHGIYPVVYRCDYDSWNHWIHAQRQCGNHLRGSAGNTDFLAGCFLHCKAYL